MKFIKNYFIWILFTSSTPTDYGINASLVYVDSGKPSFSFNSKGPDGKKHIVYEIPYQLQGGISFNLDSKFYEKYGCEFSGTGQYGNEIYIGWSAFGGAVNGGLVKEKGALFDYPAHPSGVAVQFRWKSIPNGRPNEMVFFNSSQIRDIPKLYVVAGPTGIYKHPKLGNIWAFSSGKTPLILPYVEIYGLTCGSLSLFGTELPVPPVVNNHLDRQCTFDIDNNVLDLTDPIGATQIRPFISIKVTANCSSMNGSITHVHLRAEPAQIELVPNQLIASLQFDNGSNIKYDWEILPNGSGHTGSSNIELKAITKLTSSIPIPPGFYKQSAIITISYE
ncbi:hypothetical protein RZ64_01095 [[Haemophilus] ducreyi]|uniref:hypothetical protein n=1 Tax=Haemophilus ducreyi TaxID=730 RepID=UPI000655EB20|nr:hypothetical protein [[Haemophilus] ducreyi]AKO40668.1 hypothetical protein RZ64_01095 [[Haemophilus] ducreyi]